MSFLGGYHCNQLGCLYHVILPQNGEIVLLRWHFQLMCTISLETDNQGLMLQRETHTHVNTIKLSIYNFYSHGEKDDHHVNRFFFLATYV